MDLDLSLPHLTSSSDDPSPEPETPPGTPPGSDAHLPGELKRSQPLSIQASRKLREEELRASSLPAIPNPFPELCSPPSQSPILGAPSSGRGFLSRDSSGPHVVKVYSEDGACRSVEVAADATARHVCEMLVQRAHALSDESWGLVECHPHLALERGLEDHESVAEVQAAWPVGGDSRFVFRKNFAKYELFKSSPVSEHHSLFPEVMVSSCLDINTHMTHEELIQNFLNAGSCPEIQGFLQLRGSGRKLWKRFYCFLRRSGLYYSTKGTSKDPRHLQYVADVNESNVYLVTQGRKLYGMPTDFGFCVKPNKLRSPKGLRVFCSEDEQSRSCWVAAFRLFKYGMQLYKNYQQMQSRRIRPSWFGPTPLKKTNHRYSLPNPCPGSTFSSAIHRSQPWFHGRISREDTQRLIGQQGLVDGVFLVRESQRNPQGFVLSLCHLQKVKHYLILPSEEEGRLYFSMDEGQTRFTDLLQLVEFHQLNRGILPCPLRHCCTRVAL
ncbi:growth factor receptor-bound protein 7 isoform X4 [Petaurus breviceps papuanus]|uniref:growth factor receptor-bound protein 7 isoform X4 n=1 Tax=Petaurus breviceps papuanus TaxID=3040969 RepID=UPI0036DC61B9